MLKYLYLVASACLILLAGSGKDGMMMGFLSQFQRDTSAAIAFVSGMGCSDPYCTDITHHHDCPQDCGDYNHYHNCSLDCTEAEHCHRGTSGDNESGQHHREQHHEDHH